MVMIFDGGIWLVTAEFQMTSFIKPLEIYSIVEYAY
jgi:hypothetical protein